MFRRFSTGFCASGHPLLALFVAAALAATATRAGWSELGLEEPLAAARQAANGRLEAATAEQTRIKPDLTVRVTELERQVAATSAPTGKTNPPPAKS